MLSSDDIWQVANLLVAQTLAGDFQGACRVLEGHGQDAAGRITQVIRKWGETSIANRLDASRFGRKYGGD